MHQQVITLVEHLVLVWVPAMCVLRLAVAVKFTIALKTRFYSLPISSLFPFPVFHTIPWDDAQNCLHSCRLRLHSLVCGPAEEDSDRCTTVMHLMSHE